MHPPAYLLDLSLFLDTLARLSEHPLPAARTLFTPGEPILIARAPGRLDLMGGIADYSGSLVLQLPLREAAFAALQRDPEPRIRIVSPGGEEGGRAPEFEMPLAAFEPGAEAGDYDRARDFFRCDPARAWAAYAAGAFLVLARERGARFEGGARILISSEVPEGAGVSSSAALEVAVMQAVSTAFDALLAPRELALLCQVV